jgi:hypothetical protein
MYLIKNKNETLLFDWAKITFEIIIEILGFSNKNINNNEEKKNFNYEDIFIFAYEF